MIKNKFIFIGETKINTFVSNVGSFNCGSNVEKITSKEMQFFETHVYEYMKQMKEYKYILESSNLEFKSEYTSFNIVSFDKLEIESKFFKLKKKFEIF